MGALPATLHRTKPALRRPRLEARLAEASARRLTSVVAGAGFGKTTLVAAWAERVAAAWYTAGPEDAVWTVLGRGLARALARRIPEFRPSVLAGLNGAGPEAAAEHELRPEAWAAMACEALEDFGHDVALVVDDAQEMGCGLAARLLESLCRHAPPGLHLVLVSRTDLPFPLDRMRGRGQVLELGGQELRFSEEELAEVLAMWVDPAAAELAPAMLGATGGWPAAVRLSAEALWARPPDQWRESLTALLRHEGPLFAYLAAEALAAEPPEVSDLVRTAARLDRFTAATLEAVGVPGARATTASLLRRGLFLESKPGQGWLSLYPLVREFVLERLPMDDLEEREVRRRAAHWFERAGFPEEALRELTASGDQDALTAALLRHGPGLVVSARVDTLLRAAERVPRRSPELDAVVGQALQVAGDWEGALACFRRATADDDVLPSAVAWRMGLIHYLRGEFDEARQVYERAALDGAHPAEDALVVAWLASIHFLRGEAQACEQLADRAFGVATGAGDSRGLAAAHTALAMAATLRGDRATIHAHGQMALDHAERAGDVLQLIRIRSNRACHLGEEGRYREALAELEAGLQLTEVSGFGALRAHVLTNRGETNLHLGRLDEAGADLYEARLVYERMGSKRICLPLVMLGDLYRERGERVAARTCYEEALAIVQRSPDHQIVVPALAGLAQLVAEEDPDEAAGLVKQALDLAVGPVRSVALVAAGHAALVAGDRKRAAELAAEAGAQARANRDRAAVAKALELSAAATEGREAVERLRDAIRLWATLENPVREGRAQLLLAERLGDTEGQALAAEATARLRSLGSRRYERVATELLATLDRAALPAVAVQTLGGFRVLREGKAVALGEWQSRKARDLLKIVIARRGRPVAREVVMDLLWPDENPAVVSNRLSGALVTLRGVLDPTRRFPNDHFVAADKNSVWLDRATVRVDVDHFLAAAAAGLARVAHDPIGAVDLATVEAAYGGDFLEEDPYDDWAVPVRDEARAAYLAVARRLAREAFQRGDDDAATLYCLRVLAREPYDEPAHQALIASHSRAGRHGEAARAYRAYRARMAELGLEPTLDEQAHIPPSPHPQRRSEDAGVRGREAALTEKGAGR